MHIPDHVLRELATKASVDKRVIALVALDPSTRAKNLSRRRAFETLVSAGYLATDTGGEK